MAWGGMPLRPVPGLPPKSFRVELSPPPVNPGSTLPRVVQKSLVATISVSRCGNKATQCGANPPESYRQAAPAGRALGSAPRALAFQNLTRNTRSDGNCAALPLAAAPGVVPP